MASQSLLDRGLRRGNMAPAPASDSETGLLGGIFSRQGHAALHVKFSDVDWATLVRSGGFITQQEVSAIRKTVTSTTLSVMLCTTFLD